MILGWMQSEVLNAGLTPLTLLTPWQQTHWPLWESRINILYSTFIFFSKDLLKEKNTLMLSVLVIFLLCLLLNFHFEVQPSENNLKITFYWWPRTEGISLDWWKCSNLVSCDMIFLIKIISASNWEGNLISLEDFPSRKCAHGFIKSHLCEI